VLIRNIRSQSDFLVSLRQKLLRSLGVSAQLVFVCLLCPVKLLICLDDKTLSSRQIAMSAPVNIDDGRLGKNGSNKRQSHAQQNGGSQISFRHASFSCENIEDLFHQSEADCFCRNVVTHAFAATTHPYSAVSFSDKR
jgi:hypothetical protein